MLDPEPRRSRVDLSASLPVPSGRHHGRHRLHPAGDEVTRRRVGEANPRGALERNLGPFRLRADLAAPGAIPLADAAVEVFADWDRQVAAKNVSADIVSVYGKNVAAFLRVMSAQGVERVCEVDANRVLFWLQMAQPGRPAPTRNTMSARRSAARAFFETAKCLGITGDNPAANVVLPTRSERYVRAYTTEQVEQLRRVSYYRIGETRMPALLALCISGAAMPEIGELTVADVDLEAGRFWAHDGGYRCRDRWVPFFDDWCANAISRRVGHLRDVLGEAADDAPLIYQPGKDGPKERGRSSVATNLLTQLQVKARVHRPGVTRGESIREWTAAQVFAETGSVEQVALRLGMASLDAAAHLVGYDWVAEAGDDSPPAHRQQVRS